MSKSQVISRKDMKEPDKFQEAATQAASWVAARKKQLTIAGGVAVVAVLLLAVLALVQGQREQAAGTAGSALLAAISGDVSPVPVPGAPGPNYPSEEAKQKAIVAAADKVIAEHGGTGPAELALLAKGDAHYALREWDQAKAAYERYLGVAGKQDSLRFGAFEGLGLVAEAQGDKAAAAKAYERMAQEAPAFADRADLERARVLAEGGKADEAKAILAGFAEKHPKSVLTPEAGQRLAKLGGK
jgi:tetratricopeptide (TPR) repeat protein